MDQQTYVDGGRTVCMVRYKVTVSAPNGAVNFEYEMSEAAFEQARLMVEAATDSVQVTIEPVAE